MEKNNKFKSIVKKLILAVLIVYVVSIFINQQKTLDAYKANNDYYIKQIAAEEANQRNLMSMKDNINSPEYIEEIARDKLDMCYPNETKFKIYN